MNPFTVVPMPSVLGELGPIARWRQQCSAADDTVLTVVTVGPDTFYEIPAEGFVVVAVEGESVPAAAAAVCGVLLGKNAAAMTAEELDDFGALDHKLWMANCEATRDLMAVIIRANVEAEDMADLLPDELWACVELIQSLPDKQIPALLDGPGPAAAALVATSLNPDALEWIRPLQPGMTPAEEMTWDHLRLTPVLTVRTRINDGSLAPLATATLETAVALAKATPLAPSTLMPLDRTWPGSD